MDKLFQKNIIISLLCLIILIGVALYYLKLNSEPKSASTTFVSEEIRRHGPCPGKAETIKSEEGKTYQLLPNWYACHEVGRGDSIYLKYSDRFPPVIKIAYGIPGDRFNLERDKEHEAWNIKINHEWVTDPNGVNHFFGGKAPPVLALFEKSLKGVLGAKNCIVFSEVSPGSADSGRLGVVNSDDFLGKIEANP